MIFSKPLACDRQFRHVRIFITAHSHVSKQCSFANAKPPLIIISIILITLLATSLSVCTHLLTLLNSTFASQQSLVRKNQTMCLYRMLCRVQNSSPPSSAHIFACECTWGALLRIASRRWSTTVPPRQPTQCTLFAHRCTVNNL